MDLNWILNNIALIVLGGFITKVIEILLPGSIRYKLRLWYGYIRNFIFNPRIHTSNIWKFYLGKEYEIGNIKKTILDNFIFNKIKAYEENEAIKFEIREGELKLVGIVQFGVSNITKVGTFVNELEITIDSEVPYREFFERLLALREAMFQNIISSIIKCLNFHNYSSILVIKLNKLEEATKIIDDLKVKYISLGDTYKIYLAGKLIRVADIVDSNVLKALKTLFAFYL